MLMDTARQVKRSMAGTGIHVRDAWRLAAAYAYDWRRFIAFSSTRGPFRSRANLAAKITERYHGIEKGLALPAPRPGHGAGVLEPLIRLVKRYIDSYGEDELTSAAIGAMSAYYDFNAQYLEPDKVPFGPQITELVRDYRSNPSGVSGVTTICRADVHAAVSGVGPEFFSSRHSVRVYSSEPVTDEEIEFAVTAARSAPAVCNRQFGTVRTWRDTPTIERLLAIQGGTRGFGDNVPALALVTVSLRSYWSPAERHQGWIDGGLFSMNFMLGLHAQGLGAVALNWSKVPASDRALRQALPDLGEDEAIIMFVGFGHLPERAHVAASPRIHLDRD